MTADKIVEAAARKRAEHYESEYDSTHLKWQDFIGEARELLEAVEPLIRQRTAEAIAEALEAKVQSEWGTEYEEWHDYGLRYAARIAREYGKGDPK